LPGNRFESLSGDLQSLYDLRIAEKNGKRFRG